MMKIFLMIMLGVLNAQQECPSTNKVCEYWFTVNHNISMQNGGTAVKWSDKYQKFYKARNQKDFEHIPLEKVITLDGYKRMVTTVNGTIPGPPIIVTKNQKIIVHVKNLLFSHTVTIHWHGLWQVGTPHMDGVAYITQCPIGAGETFTYEFWANQTGTYWYHSHAGAQRTNGVFGAFIIKEKLSDHYKMLEEAHDVPESVKREIRPVYTYSERIMIIGDWQHTAADEVYIKSQLFGEDTWGGILINGRGRYWDNINNTWSEAPLAVFNVTKGKNYLFRVINPGTSTPMRLSIDNHKLKVVGTDGWLFIYPVVVDFLILWPGERFIFVLNATQKEENYWIRVESYKGEDHHRTEAILRYDEAQTNYPSTMKKDCKKEGCKAINCQYRYEPTDENTTCITMGELKAIDRDSTAPKYRNDSEEHFLNFGFPSETVNGPEPASVNGKAFVFPAIDAENNDRDLSQSCNKSECGENKTCSCYHSIVVPYNKTIQFVWTNIGNGAYVSHPIHLHGHTFYVLKVGYPEVNRTTGQPLNRQSHPDIDCGGSPLCNEAKWKNSSWNNGNIPGLNLKNPVRKDTLIIPTGGYAVIRIRSKNPGTWLSHCHIEPHLLGGMAWVLVEAPENIPKLPLGFPVCKNFNDKKNNSTIPPSTTLTEANCQNDDDNKTIIYVTIPLGIVCFILGCIASCFFQKVQSGKGKNRNMQPRETHYTNENATSKF